MQNYECDLNGGYRQVEGFERYDGRQSPSGASFTAMNTTIPDPSVGSFVEGETLTQAVSGATAILLYVDDAGLYMVNVVGTFDATNTITGGTSTMVATPLSGPSLDLTLLETTDYNSLRYLKEIYYRDLIQVVPGINAVRGVFQHEGITLAIRDFDGSEARLYKQSAAGWVQVGTSHVLFYDTRAQPIPDAGTLLDDGVGNSATLLRAGPVTTAGTTGYMVLTGYTAGFAAGTNIEDAATVIAVVATGGAPVEFTLNPVGKSEWISHNYTGAPNRYRVYMTDGVNPCVEYDPIADAMSPIYTDQANIAEDIPAFVAEYRNHLFVGYKEGKFRNSEPGDPYLWDAAAGSLETFVGAELTGFDSVPKALIVATKRTTYALSGQIAENFLFDVASAKTGAKPYTIQHIGSTHMIDDRGIIDLARTETFGNFQGSTISRLVQPLLKVLRGRINSSAINLSKNIYRLMTSDGDGVSVTFQEGRAIGFGTYSYNIDINVLSHAEDDTGQERTFVGSDDGFVYELDKGVSFDGVAKESWLQTVFHNLGSSTIRKRFYRAFFDILVTGNASVDIMATYSNESLYTNTTVPATGRVFGSKSAWDSGSWNNAVFDTSSVIGSGYLHMNGTGDSVSLIIYSSSVKDDILTFKDVLYKYKPRGGLRRSR
ncbi:MAG: hypothetical protein GY746_11040 [Gammaproteobacteria bacterium]|nr:hypothetical protein [Gammaproteobacteria bacterium]